MIMDRLYGGVCYAGIDVDPELKYPKGKFIFVWRIRFLARTSFPASTFDSTLVWKWPWLEHNILLLLLTRTPFLSNFEGFAPCLEPHSLQVRLIRPLSESGLDSNTIFSYYSWLEPHFLPMFLTRSPFLQVLLSPFPYSLLVFLTTNLVLRKCLWLEPDSSLLLHCSNHLITYL